MALRHRLVFACIVIVLSLLARSGRRGRLRKTETGVGNLDGQPSQRASLRASQPYHFGLIGGRRGKEMTRAWPVRELPPGDRAKRPITYIKNRLFDHWQRQWHRLWAETARHPGNQVQTDLSRPRGAKSHDLDRNEWRGPMAQRAS